MSWRHARRRIALVFAVLGAGAAVSAPAAHASGGILIPMRDFPPTPAAVSAPVDVVRGADGITWVADAGSDRVLKLSASGLRLATYTSDGSGTPFRNPQAVAVDSQGRLYVADTDNHRIVVIGPTGVTERVFGSMGSGSGQLKAPAGVAADSAGRIWVADTDNDRIQRFTAEGDFDLIYGSSGSGIGEFTGPRGISISQSGEVYIADTGNQRIAVLGPDASWRRSWGPDTPWQYWWANNSRYSTPSDVWVAGTKVYVIDTGGVLEEVSTSQGWILSPKYNLEVCTTTGVTMSRWSTPGTGASQFTYPRGIWADDLSVWVADTSNDRLSQLTVTGDQLQIWQAAGAGETALSRPGGVALDTLGNTYVADSGNNRVQKYSPSGTHLSSIGTSDLSNPSGVAIDSAGNLYVADTGNNRAVKYTSAGVLAATYGQGVLNQPGAVAVGADGVLYVADTGNHKVRSYNPDTSQRLEWGEYGTGTGQFSSPAGIAVAGDAIYVSDTGNARISRFIVSTVASSTGSWGSRGRGPGAFRGPLGIAVANDGAVWVCDSENDRLQEFTPDGQFLSQFGTTGGQLGQFHAPAGLALSSSGSIVVAERTASRVTHIMTDYLPPVTGTSGLSTGWAKEVTATLLPTDDVGVAFTRYRINSNAAALYSGPFGGFPEGQSMLQYASVDLVGRVEETQSVSVRVDRTPPLTTPNPASGWHRSPVTLTLGRFDSLSGVALTTYTIDAAPAQVYAGSVLVSGQGNRVLRFRSTDAAGNLEAEKSVPLRIDDSPPATTSDATQVWRSTPETLTLLSTDMLSGVDRIVYRVGMGTSKQYTGPFVVDSEGETAVTYYAVDVAGNVESMNTRYVRVDRSAPVSIMTAAVPFGDRTRRITINATDAGVGVAKTYCSIDGEPATEYTTPFSISAETPAEITFWAVDKLGHAEAPRTVHVEWDYTPPVTSSNIDADWRRAPVPVLVSLTATDGSGPVRSTHYRIGESITATYTAPFGVSFEGETKVSYWSVDQLGNVESPRTEWVRIDRTPPVSAFEVGDPTGEDTRLVTLSAQDSAAGGVSIHYRIDGSDPATYTAPFHISSLVPVTVDYWAVDRLGNREETQTTLVDEDFAPPVTTCSLPQAVVWSRDAAQVSLDATDVISGVFATYYRVGGGAVTTYTGTPFTVDREGQTPVTFWSVDNKGLREPDQTRWVRIDRTPPVSRLVAEQPFSDRTRFIVISAEDEGVGELTTFCSVDGADPVEYTAPVRIDASRPITVSFNSSDSLGNREATQTIVVTYDYVPPVTTSDLDGAWRRTAATVGLTATDTMSTVDATYYRVADGPVNTYTGTPFTVDREGETRVTYWSVDSRSNVESANVGLVRIDRTPPETVSSVIYDPFQSAAIVTLQADDAGSGLGGIQYRLGTSPAWLDYTGGIYLGTAGDNTIYYRATDLLGNVEDYGSRTITLRELVPTTTSDIDGEWHGGEVGVRLSAAYEGTASVTTYYQVGTGSTVTYSGLPFTISAEGETLVRYWSVAKGVIEPKRSDTVRIDLTPPVTSYQHVVTTNPNSVTISLQATDPAGSGVARTEYATGGDVGWIVYTGPFELKGASVVRFRSIDNVGNEESFQTRTIAPVTRVNRSSTYWYRSAVPVSVIATHPSGAPTLTYYRIGGQTLFTRYTGPITVSNDGLNAISYWSKSGAAVEPSNVLYLHIDKTKPVISYLASPTHPRTGTVYRSRNVRFRWSGYDRTSRIYGYAYKLDRYRYTNPSTTRATSATTAYYTNRSRGTWYFHVRARDRAGNWGPTRHFRVRIR